MYVGMYVCIFAQYSLYVNYEVKGFFSFNRTKNWHEIDSNEKSLKEVGKCIFDGPYRLQKKFPEATL